MGRRQKLADKINSLLPFLNEKQKGIYLATETNYLGRSGKLKLEKLVGVFHNTINRTAKKILPSN